MLTYFKQLKISNLIVVIRKLYNREAVQFKKNLPSTDSK